MAVRNNTLPPLPPANVRRTSEVRRTSTDSAVALLPQSWPPPFFVIE